MSIFGIALAMGMACLGIGIGQGMGLSKGLDGIAKQPEASNKIQTARV